MAWEIKVWHDDDGDRTRLVVEAGPEVPDEVISAVAGSYWLEEVQYVEEGWQDPPWGDGGEGGSNEPGSRMHG